MKYLVIAEKPSVARSISKVIGAYKHEDGYLEGGDCVVSWCLGHLAEYAAPEYYDERYKSWRFDDLPILPEEWKLLVSEDKKAHFNILRKLLRSKDFDYVVNACDAGREGEAIFRRVYGLAGSKLPVKRLWMLMSGRLNQHLAQIDEQAENRMEELIESLNEKYPAPNKETEQMAWVAHQNNLTAMAEEIVLKELVYN